MLLSVLARALQMMLLWIVTIARGAPLGSRVLRWLLRWLAHRALRSCGGRGRGGNRAGGCVEVGNRGEIVVGRGDRGEIEHWPRAQGWNWTAEDGST